ncbi:hypothetical protein CK623_00815 [Vandammella animalimorsus]|uniref:IPTL-CTERM protein sorting domain-containing protein n=1 Tax=Vandammella animalimorsus TaxID=2029117 RepID=A0A2A2ASF7_9BURK|nr:IPTL-CTERM sorting domain-containing protein [Vandammella animalimorsus]PAT41510.1 hypothetical protein CK623_00815 [Vandammella animalimorsus]
MHPSQAARPLPQLFSPPPRKFERLKRLRRLARWAAGAALALGAAGAAQAQHWRLDASFSGDAGAVLGELIQKDGKLWAIHFGVSAGSVGSLRRLDATSGAKELQIQTNGKIFTQALQANGKLLVGGDFTQFPKGQMAGPIVSLNLDGTRDASFSAPYFLAPLTKDVSALAVQADGKILVGGEFYKVDYAPAHGLVRLNADGSRDTSFQNAIPSRPDDYYSVTALLILPNGQILAAGFRGLDRLDPDGSLANTGLPSFGGSWNDVYALHRLASGKILVGGKFTSAGGQPYEKLARLNADGTLDTSFVNPGIQGSEVRVIHELPNGQILIGGNFTQVQGQPRAHLALLNADGTLDTQFSAPALSALVHTKLEVLSFTRQADGKLLVGGYFTMQEGAVKRTGLVRLIPPATHAINTAISPAGSGTVTCSPSSVFEGGNVTCTATANAGYTFSAFSGDCTGTTCTLTNVTSAKSVTAKFTATAHAITTAISPKGSGTVGCSPNPVPNGGIAICKASAKKGFVFDSFSGDCSGTSSTCALTNVTSAKSVTAKFTAKGTTHAITATASPTAGGTVSCTPNPVPNGGNATCTVTANTGYTFTSFSGDCTGTTCTLTNVTSAKNVTANFTAAATTHAITTAVNPAGSGTVSCTPNPVPNGGDATCTATANTGFAFDGFSGDCTGTSPTCTLTNVTSAKSVTAAFKDVRRRFEGTTVPPSGAGAPAVATFTGGGANCRFDAGSTAFIAAPAAPPSGQAMPHGALRFKLVDCDPGSTVNVTVRWPGPVDGALKYGRASASATADSFYAHPGISASGNTTSITLTDGGLGDADNAANGEISDPLAATTAITAGPMGVTAVPTLGHWGLMLLGLAAAGLGARRLRKAA